MRSYITLSRFRAATETTIRDQRICCAQQNKRWPISILSHLCACSTHTHTNCEPRRWWIPHKFQNGSQRIRIHSTHTHSRQTRANKLFQIIHIFRFNSNRLSISIVVATDRTVYILPEVHTRHDSKTQKHLHSPGKTEMNNDCALLRSHAKLIRRSLRS